MSIAIWAACSLAMPGDLPEPENWKSYEGNYWAYETALWQVVVEPAQNTNVPAEVTAMNSTAIEGMFATVEPIRAGESAYRFLNSVAVAVATKCGGAILQGPMGLVQLDAEGRETRG
jgi:hypothetical protein